MKLTNPKTLKELAEILSCSFVGDENHLITGINEIHQVESGDLVFVDHPKYYDKALNSAATTIIIDKEVECPEGKGLLISKLPFDDYNKLTKMFMPEGYPIRMKGENLQVDPSAIIAPNVFLGNDVTIGKNVILHSGVSIQDRTTIGDNVIIGPNTVIGHYAFYYKKKEAGFDRMYSCGGTVIENDVEIGACCTIDRGVSGNTSIGAGTKIDNHVHIGHDTVIGKKCLLASQVGLAGCVTLKDEVTLWGQVGCASDIILHEKVVVLAQSGITKDLEAGKTYFGSPAGEVKEKYRELASIRQLPELLKKNR